MAKKRKAPILPTQPVTAKRAARLYRLINLLGTGPQTRAALARRLRMDVRSFYRDLELLRDSGIPILLEEGRYVLKESLREAITHLPFPDPCLTLGEAIQLAKGRGKAHLKIKEHVSLIVK